MKYDVSPSFVRMDIDALRVVVHVYEMIDGEVKVDKIDFKKTTSLQQHNCYYKKKKTRFLGSYLHPLKNSWVFYVIMLFISKCLQLSINGFHFAVFA